MLANNLRPCIKKFVNCAARRGRADHDEDLLFILTNISPSYWANIPIKESIYEKLIKQYLAAF
jgi:hypothetical protein